MKIFFTIFGILTSVFLIGQNNTAHQWFFGNNAGVDFSTGVPTAIIGGALYTGEGCATVGDSVGNLLFYTDGQTVYNRNHQTMPNGTGLLGHISATQSSIIIPYPNSDSLFYIFTVDAGENHLQNGLRYSIVDISLDGGLGNITSTKNILLETPVTEKQTAILHSNNINIWLVAHRWDSDEFIAYKITPLGIDTTPIVSAIGSIHQGGYSTDSYLNGWTNAAGYMKSNKQGNKIAIAIHRMDKFELFDFDKSTGILSNYYVSPSTFVENSGLEFSPDGTKLYGSLPFSHKVYQFDITQANPFDNPILIASTILEPSTIQTAPNGKIYISERTNGYLSAIHNPNELGLNCNYESESVYLEGNVCRRGLPSLFYYKGFQFFTGSEVDTSICDGDSVYLENSYQTTAGIYYDTIQSSLGWDSILTINLAVNNVTSTTINTTACGSYSSPSGNSTWTSSGTYYDTIPNITGCDSIITVNLTINQNSNSTINTTECDSYISPSGNSTWTNSDTYYDTIPNTSGCDSIITINLIISTVDASVVQFGSTLFANASGASYQWVDCDNSFSAITGANNQSFTPTVSGNYAVIVNQNNCTDISTCYNVIIIGISESLPNSQIFFFPNPTTGKIKVEAKNIKRIEVLDITGKTLTGFEILLGLKPTEIDLSTHSKGIYFIKITTEKSVVVEKVVLK